MSGITELKETPIVSTPVRQVEGQTEGQMEVNMAQTYRYYSPAAGDRLYAAPRSNQTAPAVYTQPRFYNESPLPPKRRSQRSQPTPVFVYPDVPPEPKPEYSCNGDDCCGCFN